MILPGERASEASAWLAAVSMGSSLVVPAGEVVFILIGLVAAILALIGRVNQDFEVTRRRA